MNKKSFILYLLFTVFFLFSCKSIVQPESVVKQLDYSDSDVVNNEKKNIKKLQQGDIVEALYHAYFLKDDEVLKECIQLVENQIQLALNDKDYLELDRLYLSLKTIDYETKVITQKQINNLRKLDLPGTQISADKRPKNIQDCINATVTMWVDKGLKIQNGAGIQDIVIGSGFFIDERGYLVTNYHVISSMVDSKYEGYSRLYIKLPSDPDTKIPAKVVGYDSVLDIALIKTDIEPPFCLSLGSSADLNVGDKISAIGTPIGLEGTLTSGIISAADRKLNTMGSVFQLDAAVNSGNSGGPIVDENMKVQAIVFAGMLQYQGLNFAIPVEYLKQELPILYDGGEVLHTWIGAYGNTKKIRSEKTGVELYYTMPGGSAHFSKLQAGDIITELDGRKIFSLEDLQLTLMAYAPGSLVQCKYKNEDGIEKHTVLYLNKRPEAPGVAFFNSDIVNGSFIPLFGMEVYPSSTTNKKLYTITKVLNGTTADEMGFSENDPVTIQKVEIDTKNEMIVAQLYVQRRKKGFLDVSMVVGSPFDSPYYF